MNKLKVQKRVLQFGKPLDLDKFSWCEKTKTFSTSENYCVIDFTEVEGVTIVSGDCSIQKAGDCSIQKAGDFSIQKAGNNSTQTAGWSSTQTAGACSIIKVLGKDCVIINRDVFEVIIPKKGDIIQICPYGIKGHLVNGMYEGKPHIIADNILSEIISQKGNVYKVRNYGKKEITYLIKKGDVYSHGKTLKEAKESLIYKISNRDTSKYKDLTLDSVISFADAVIMYRAITGACEDGCRYFIEQNIEKKKAKYKVSEVIKLTKGQYGNNLLIKFFNKGG